MGRKKPEAHGLWLFKEEPDHYSYADLERDGKTVWDGVSNNLARQHLWKVRPGDRVLYYHTGKEKAIVGEIEVVSEPYVQDHPPEGDAKAVVVVVKSARRWARPVTLTEIKKQEELQSWDLVRLPRLSVVPVTNVQWKCVEQMSRAGGAKFPPADSE